MEEDQQPKHVCKLCDKSFPCGRSLGGHMRSHMMNSSHDESSKLTKKKLLSIKHAWIKAKPDTTVFEAGANAGAYGLRENPKKTPKFAGSNNEYALLHDKMCRECGKGFQSWKALFGHMKCHSEKFSNSLEVEDSWSQSDNETAAPNRKKRSRRVRRYLATTSSSLSMANNNHNNNNNNASSSVSENDQLEQEEVAMCLMMLSRDMCSHKFSVDESSDNNFELLEAGSSIWINRVAKTEKFKKLRYGKLESAVLETHSQFDCSKQSEYKLKKSKVGDGGRFRESEVELGKNYWPHDCENVKFKKLKNGKLESATLDYNSQFASGFSINTSKSNRFFGDDKSNKSRVEDESVFEASEIELGKNLVKENVLAEADQFSSKKKSICSNLESGSKSKFECTTCNKTFHSYQALGGHRASHKKTKGCFATKTDSNENSIETKTKPPQNESRPIDKEKSKKTVCASKKPNKDSHECPICFKVFPSGQALGGHKRTHLVGGSEAKSNQSVVIIQKPIPETRDFLDLNLPAPTEEVSNIEFKPWWVGIETNVEHEPVFGLISN
ncbi:Zinc finger protein [Actinidia chinensis var. chinensis]|uniref:Zinc finger protein n=1 Tax=Actinidia chinensis var. chinensis TaxID=1590841 RepID=A0A2R6PCN1_ACTCC|nr:Zinc finger protein [Actinidia chinensis var. chinensis]